MTAAMALVALPRGGPVPARGSAGAGDAKFVQVCCRAREVCARVTARALRCVTLSGGQACRRVVLTPACHPSVRMYAHSVRHHIQDLLHSVHHIEAPIKCIQGTLFVRISAHIYNTAADYDALAAAVLEVVAQQ
jgi:hypothetical protein